MFQATLLAGSHFGNVVCMVGGVILDNVILVQINTLVVRFL